MYKRVQRLGMRVALFLAVAATGFLCPGPAQAQSPTPTHTMVSHNTLTQPNPYPYVVVEQGDDFCKQTNGLGRLETATVASLQAGKAVVSEITIDNVCGYSIPTYEGFVNTLVSYVEANGPNASQKWLGIMLDEESRAGVSPPNLQALNSFMINKMRVLPGETYWFNELFVGQGDWAQSVYNAIMSGSDPAPQISTSFMVTYANSSGAPNNLVTWALTYPAPYNNQATSVNSITGLPYVACPYVNGTECNYLSNQFISS